MEQNKIFQSQQTDKVRKSAFDLSHTKALSGVMGDLIPTMLMEIIPGDEINIQQENFVRLAPMLAPVMHMINLTTHFFFVPNRIIWDEWEDFITGGKDGTSEPLLPTLLIRQLNDDNDLLKKKLADYMGLPTQSDTNNDEDMAVNILPFRAYQTIYNEYYRDQTLNDEVDITSTLSSDIGLIRKSSWEKDYFTSALPFMQRGAEIGIPIEVEYQNPTKLYWGNEPSSEFESMDDIQTDTDGNLEGLNELTTPGFTPLIIKNIANDLDFTINELRTSSALQRFLEKQATGGYRYTETLRNHFNVHSGDARLNRPEYLGGGKNPVVITEVLSNSNTLDSSDNVVSPLGEMAGHAVASGQTISANLKAKEHGYLIGITRVLPNTQYFQGIPKHFLYDDKFDYAWPELANLGEQPVLNCELYYDSDIGAANWNKGTFGYQQRYAQYKFMPSTVHGDFRTNLKYWHMAREFSSRPALNGDFVKANPTTRIFNVVDEDHLWIQILNKVKALRPLPYFSNPQLK